MRFLHRSGVLGVLVASCLVGGCDGGGAPASGQAASPASGAAPSKTAVKITDKDRKRAKDIFSTVCATCHGTVGHGDGPGSAALNPKPRNFHDPSWQASVTDDHIEQTALMGGASVGKSPQMPAHPFLRDAPAVLASIREIVRGFGKQPDAPTTATGTAR